MPETLNIPGVEPVRPETVGLSSSRLARIPDYFQTYLDRGKLPCVAALIARRGRIAHLSLQGSTELGGADPIRTDTIYRIYSMTKPVTSVAAMMLFEEGALRLDHELHRYIPEMADIRVWDGGTVEAPRTRPPARPILIRDLFLHTAGFSYAFLFQSEVDAYYRANGLDHSRHVGGLAQYCRDLARAPILFSPGERWNYSVAIDVLGRVVEIVSGMTLDRFFAERIFAPLGMTDTGFTVAPAQAPRLAACYARDPQTGAISQSDPRGAGSVYNRPPNLLSGGGGLVSTIGDYLRFCLMLSGGGRFNGVRLLSPKTLAFMRMNHLPGGSTIAQMGDRTFSETRMEGSGFGLGWAVTTDVIATTQPGSPGTFSWGGMASTFFWIDPVENLIAIQMTQLMPSGAYPIRPQLQQLVYAAIED